MINSERVKSIILALVILLTVGLSGCGNGNAGNQQGGEDQAQQTQSTESESSLYADTITLSGGDWGYPTPFAHYSRGPGSRKKALIYDTFLSTDDSGNAAVALAEEWTAGEDGLSYVFKLRSGVTWQDGEAFTADDVVFSYQYENQYPPVSVPDFSTIKSVTAEDEMTVKIELTESDSKFLSKMTSFTIIPEHIWKDVTDPYNYVDNGSAIGTGPYILTDYSKEQGLYRFEENENFWGEKVHVKAIEFVPVSESVLAFEQGETDRISIKPDILSRFENNSEYEIMQYVTSWAYRLYFNMSKSDMLANVEFRQALAYAMNRQDMVDMLERGAAVAGNSGILHPNNELYKSDVPQYSYDQSKAAEMLDNLGYKDNDGDGIREDGSGEKLSFNLLTDSGSARLGELIKSQLSPVGIDIAVQSVDQKSRDARFAKGDFELCINGSGGGEDFSELTHQSKSKATSSTAAVLGYDNARLDELYEKYQKETDPQNIQELMDEMQQIAANELPKLTLYYTNTIAVHRPAVYDGWGMESYHNDSRSNYVFD